MRKFKEVIKGVPFEHQRQGIAYLYKHHYSILGDEQGLGKTFQAISLSLMLGEKTLVFCPAYLKLNWEKEFYEFSKIEVRILVVDKAKDIAQINSKSNFDVIIINYKKLISPKFQNYLSNLFGWAEVIIADEFQYLKSLKAKRTEIFHNLIYEKKPYRLIGLTGTAVMNNVAELFSLLALTSYTTLRTNGADITEKYPSFYKFVNQFTHVKKYRIKGRTIVRYEGVRNLDELKGLMKFKYLRRTGDECLDLPDLIRKDVLVDHRRDTALQATWDSKGKDITAKVDSAKKKVPHTINYIKELLEAEEGPVVVYSDHVWPVEKIASYFLGADCITGSTPMKERQRIIEDFQAGKTPVLAATIGAASTGINLHRARHLIFNDMSWVPSNNSQAEKRIHRIGQKHKCIIHRLAGSYVDMHINKLITKKMEVIRKVL